VRFDDVLIDDGALLGRPGEGMAVFQLAMTFERALVLAFRLGAMQRALDEAVRGVRKRGVGKHQAVSRSHEQIPGLRNHRRVILGERPRFRFA
jgi:alkylation response protein AidB-like acyl-CoA dehydrogenase